MCFKYSYIDTIKDMYVFITRFPISSMAVPNGTIKCVLETAPPSSRHSAVICRETAVINVEF